MSWKRFLTRSRWDDERARELEAHLAIETDENVARGMALGDARAAAQRKLGNRTRVREDIYRMNTVEFIDVTWRDLKHGARMLRRNPGFACIAILLLALGVGANTAIFQLVDAVRLRALPVAHPEQLVDVRISASHGRSGGFVGPQPNLTNPLWERIRDQQQAFSGAFAWTAASFELSAGGESRPAEGLWVSGEFFDTLDVHPVIGRILTPADDRRGCASPPAVVSYGFWQRELGGSPSAIGRTLTLDGHSYDIVGVTPAGFFGVEIGRNYDVALPLCAEPLARGVRSYLDKNDGWFLAAMGRLKPDWSIEKATAHLKTISPAIFRDTLASYRPEEEKAYLAFTLAAYPARTGASNLRDEYESPLWLLLATTALVLLIACANMANLMLARATAREREIAVRLALGASRGRIVRELLAESVLIAAAGAAAGAVLAQSLSHALVAALTTQADRVFVAVEADWRMFAFVALLGVTTCAIFGLIPSIRATHTSPGAAMKAGSRGTTDGRERFGLRRLLVVAQVALSLVLVMGALLFTRSLRNLVTVDAGFDPGAILVSTLDFSRTGLSDAGVRAAQHELLERLRHQPSAEDAAQVRIVPVSGMFSNRNIVVDGVTRKEDVNRNVVSDGYFQTMRTALLAGRDFDSRDDLTTPRVTIVTESFARVFYGGQSPVGRTFQIDEPPGRSRPRYEIVGLARDSKFEHLREPFAPLMYIPAAQDDQTWSTTQRLVVRTRAPLASMVSAVTALASQAHPSVIVNFRTVEAQLRDSLLRERLIAALSGAFGGLAVLIAMVGLYGVMSYSVARRRNEIGIRLALGADRGTVVAMVMREAGRLLVAGLTLGTVFALVAGKAASTFLFGLKANDPVTLTAAIVVLSLVSATASYVPAWRASRLEPRDALRES